MLTAFGRTLMKSSANKPGVFVLYSGLSQRSLKSKPNPVTSYILDKYVNLVKSYEKALERNFPAALKVYQVYSVGLKFFKNDTIILFRAFKKATSEGLSSLSRKELEIYYQMPKDMVRAAPVLVIGAGVPLCGFIFVLAHYFPRVLLTHHFWSLQQKSEFSLINHKKTLQYYKPVFRCMQTQLKTLTGSSSFYFMQHMLEKLGSGVHPNHEMILSCKPLFEKAPYGLSYLSRNHVVNLLKLYDMHRGWRRRARLHQKAYIIHLMDKSLAEEGLYMLTQDELKWHCFIRGLNPINMRKEDIYNWLQTWLKISQRVDSKSYSLLLHCPILLSYNQPSNWWLLHDHR